jgi:hypothetical protein
MHKIFNGILGKLTTFFYPLKKRKQSFIHLLKLSDIFTTFSCYTYNGVKAGAASNNFGTEPETHINDTIL